jgi:hypothetical protein
VYMLRYRNESSMSSSLADRKLGTVIGCGLRVGKSAGMVASGHVVPLLVAKSVGYKAVFGSSIAALAHWPIRSRSDCSASDSLMASAAEKSAGKSYRLGWSRNR